MYPGIHFLSCRFYCGIGPLWNLIMVSSNSQALLFLQDKLLESVWKLLIPIKKFSKLLDLRFSELI